MLLPAFIVSGMCQTPARASFFAIVKQEREKILTFSLQKPG
jgi:hypothetical protein